jgi:NAD(P)-dependent dehydrogenase (short-subunit alcohol dehydrogenase family)
MSLFDLRSDCAAVIGGTGVLGGALASGLAAAGARVFVLGRHAERGEARAARIRSEGGRADFVACDAQDRTALEAALPPC